jgi:ribonuclease HI
MIHDVTIYAGAACKTSPGRGGYAAVVLCDGQVKEIANACPLTTRHRMELTAVIAGFEALQKPCRVTVYSDSKYLAHALNKRWRERWTGGKTLKNKMRLPHHDLWDRLFAVTEPHTVTWCSAGRFTEDPWYKRVHTLALMSVQKSVQKLSMPK